MAVFVLVHGFGGGGWYWRRTARALRDLSQTVYTPTLTGLGERAHLLGRKVDLDTHIADISMTLEVEELHDVVLVGHSYGGMVVTGAADRQHARIKHLIYLDGFVPEAGQSIMDLQPPERREYYRTVANDDGDGWRIPSPPASFWKLTDRQDLAWVDRLSVDHPLACLEQQIQLSHPQGPVSSRSFIWASDFTPSPFEKFAAAARNDHRWRYREINSGHMMMVSHPMALAEILVDLVQ